METVKVASSAGVTESVEAINLTEPTREFAEHALRNMGWEGRICVEQMTSKADRRQMVFDFGSLARLLLGKDSLEQPLLNNPRVVLNYVYIPKLLAWLRDSVSDAELADAISDELDTLAEDTSERTQMVVVRRYLYYRSKQFERALEKEC